MTEQTKKCDICGLANAQSGTSCGDCTDIYLATSATVTVLDSVGVEEKQLRAALGVSFGAGYQMEKTANLSQKSQITEPSRNAFLPLYS